MFFCGACTNQHQNQHEIQLRDPFSNQTISRLQNSNQKLLLSAMKQAKNFHVIIPSNYKQHLQKCIKQNTKFDDPQFPANDKSLNFIVPNRKIIWKRITDILPKAVMIQGQIQPADIQQGNLGDCYFLASLASIAQNPQRIKRIFCNQMEIKKQGIYRFQIVQAGQYKEIYIDDKIPVFQGSNRPVFCKPSGNQVWVLLIQKVWAKISGSYGHTTAGYPHQVLNTFMISPSFYDEIPASLVKQPKQKQQLWRKITQASKHNMPVCVGSRQAHTCKGIRPAHTYSLLDSYQITTKTNQIVRLLKLRNPWGDFQYRGRYSQYDQTFWNQVDVMLKLAIFKKQSQNDGIFTIELNQFIRNFQCLDICHDLTDYNYISKKLTVNSCQAKYFQLQIDSTQAKQYYITMQKQFDRNAYINTRKIQYGYSRILLARKHEIIQQNNQNQIQVTYQYINSLTQTNFPDITLRQKSLQPGKYILLIQTEFPDKKQQNISISIYSKSATNFTQIKKPHPQFLHLVFSNHAHQRIPFQNRNILSQSVQDWTTSTFMYKQGGYGYFCVCLGQNSKQRVQIVVDVNKVLQSGFIILQKRQSSIFDIIVQKNQQALVLFGIDFKRNLKQITFPPRGIRIARII